MNKIARLMTLVAALLLLTTYVFPMWKISLWAPQYPEGLSMSIWSHKLTGDITTINILNHYIGMAAIDEASFPELKFFPIAFGVLMGLGILSAIIGRAFMFYGWATTMVGFSLWAMYDFWKWEYNFGHNLNPDAAIKMEDMTYQPPLIGNKEFLNIYASSWPDIAGYAFALAVGLSVSAAGLAFLNARKASKAN